MSQKFGNILDDIMKGWISFTQLVNKPDVEKSKERKIDSSRKITIYQKC